MPRFDVTTIGEASLRMSVPIGMRLETARQFDVHIAGAEANVTGALSRLRWQCGWVSRLPDTPIGYRVRQSFTSAGLDLSAVNWTDDGNLASLYVEYADAPRVTQVFFNRKHSCFTRMKAEQVDWSYLLDTRLLHLTGITTALSPSCENIVAEATRLAREKNVPISFDVNYRKKLWSIERAREALLPMIQDVDLLFCSERDAQKVFGCDGALRGKISQLTEQCNAKKIVMSRGDAGLTGYDGEMFITEDAVNVKILDRIGAGDALAAGVIHGWLQGDFAKGLRYGVTMAALALSQYGDMVITSSQELEALIKQTYDGIER
ncbi:MAG: sugar kinase [Chloroflexi bacterium]|nr:MAG: sugar kinase [Chloroflexota bacterium]